MNRDEADRVIGTLNATYDRIAAAMYAVDSHSGLGFLRGGGLAGLTASARETLDPAIDEAWTEFAAIGDALESARAVRAVRRPSDEDWATLERALAGDGGRGLEARCAEILARLSDVDASWTVIGTAIAPVTDAMTTLTELARDIDETGSLGSLDRRVTLLRDRLLGDPLGMAPRGVLAEATRVEITNLTADIATESRRLSAIAAIRDGYPRRIAQLSAALDGVEALEAGVVKAYARVNEKITNPGLPPAPTATPVLRARIADLARSRTRPSGSDPSGSGKQRGQWQRLADDIATLDASIARAGARADELRVAADGLVNRRDELRGRLDAYRAKAASHALDEHDELSKLHVSARTLLYTAPCDLPGSTRAVLAYQRALTALLDAGNGRKEAR